MNPPKTCALFAATFTLSVLAAAPKGELLFGDDFNRAELGPAWRVTIPAFQIEEGALKGWQARADHGAVGGFKVTQPDGVLECRFKLAGSTGFNAVWDDKGYKGSHAGHICRVVIAPTQIRLGDDREGIMRNDIFELRRDPKRKAEADALLVGRGATFRTKIEQNRWYHLRITILGEEMTVELDDQPIGSLRSPGIGHRTKTDFHFTVSGKGAFFDDLRWWGRK